jgi:hypothetical protein
VHRNERKRCQVSINFKGGQVGVEKGRWQVADSPYIDWRLISRRRASPRGSGARLRLAHALHLVSAGVIQGSGFNFAWG